MGAWVEWELVTLRCDSEVEVFGGSRRLLVRGAIVGREKPMQTDYGRAEGDGSPHKVA